MIEALPTSKISSAALGTVEVCGQAEMISEMLDPIYSQPCVFYDIEVTRHQGKRQVTVYKRTSNDNLFRVVDETGAAVVNPCGADLYFKSDIDTGIGLFSNPDMAVKQFVNALGYGSSWSGVRVRAKILRPGDSLYVLGHASSAPTGMRLKDSVIRTGINAALSLAQIAKKIKSNTSYMAKMDVNGDGNVDSEEWDKGLARYKQEFEAELQRRATPLANDNLIMIGKETGGLLVLADRSEREFLSQLDRLAFLQIIGGPLLALACGAYLGHRFRWF
jgi:hypothetical protein